jgi:hypothetical protein
MVLVEERGPGKEIFGGRENDQKSQSVLGILESIGQKDHIPRVDEEMKATSGSSI